MKKKEDIGPSSATVLDKESEKRLKDFFSKKSALDKRWKSFHSYREFKADSPAELKKFYQDNFHVVFTLLQDAVTDFNAQAAKGKRDAKYLDQIVVLLQTIVDYLSELIGRKWQTKALLEIISSMLYKQNKLELRLRGLEIFISFIGALDLKDADMAANKDTLTVLGQALLFQPFLPAGQTVSFAFHPLEAPNEATVWLPGGTSGEADADALMRKAFECIGKSGDFATWFSVLKWTVFPVLFPKVCHQIGTLPADQNTGFVNDCPAKILRILLHSVDAWMKDSKKITAVWADPQNAQLLLEMFSQAMGVPSLDSDVALLALGSFYQLFFSAKPAAEIASRLPAYRAFFLKKIPLIFSKTTDPGTLTQHVKLCQESMKLFRTMASQSASLDKPTIDLILAVPLNALSLISSNSVLAGEVAKDLAHTSLKIWVVLQPETTWKPLQGVLSVCFNAAPSTIDAALELFFQVTLIVQKFYYPSKVVKESKRQLGAEGQRTAGHFSRSPDWRPLREAPEPDPEIADLPWNAKSALQMWTNIKMLFSALSTITDATNQARAVEACSYVSDYLLQQDAAVPFESLAQANQCRPLELIDYFGPVYCEVLDQAADAFAASRALAAGALCRLYCRQTDPVPLVILKFVYCYIAKELEERPLSSASFEIIANTGSFFSLALPGSFTLIPFYLGAIKAIVDHKGDVPDLCLRNCITVVVSLIFFPKHFADLSITLEIRNFPLSVKNRAVYTASDLEEHLQMLLPRLLSRVTKPEHVFMILCGYTAIAMNECRSSDRSPVSRKYVTETVTKILQHCSNENMEIAIGALHCIATLANDVSSITAFDPYLPQLAMQGLANVIIGHLTSVDQGKKFAQVIPAVIAAFETLEEWALVVPTSVVEQVSRPLFSAIELGLLGREMVSEAEDKTGGAKKKKKEPSVVSLDAMRQAPVHGSKEIQEVAEVLLRSMLSLHGQWPGPGGPELTGTVIRENSDPDKEDSDVNYFYANGSIVSLIPSSQGERTVRMIIRDEMDRYAWDAKAFFDLESQAEKKLVPLSSMVNSSSPPVEPMKNQTRYRRQAQEPPMWKVDEDARGVDKVGELLKYLSESYDDCKYDVDVFDIADEIKPLVEDTARLMDKQQEIINSPNPRAVFTDLPFPALQQPSDNYHWSRLLLSHFNMVDYDQRALFSMLERGTPLQRSINTLDTKRAREVFKVGVIYVRRGQDAQEQILRNETRSQFYDSFIRSLAWEVNMMTHRGYNGGLDTTKFLTGVTAPYFATARLELMFHDLTCMPTDPKDEQQIHKKRHVGNDVVNVVFSEHVRDYDPATISTQFNCAHIIVYPLPNGLYRVQICRKEEQVYPLFGPLLHNMCVSADCLPLLVRQTSLNANRNFTSHKAGYLMPFPNRSKDVVQLLGRYKEDNKDYTKTIKAAFGPRFETKP